MGEYEETMTSGKDAAHAAAKAGFGKAPYTNLGINQDLSTIVAIGMSESGGNASADHTNSDGTRDAGYWQINQVHWRGLTESAVKDLNVNARLAAEVYAKQGFNAWTDYKNGKYRSKLSAAQNAVKSLGTESVNTGIEDIAGAEVVGDVASTVGDTLSAAYNILSDGAKWIGNPGNWIRIVQVVGGVVVGVTAISLVLKETDIGKSAVGVVSKGAIK
jgi:hypothetical protein